MLYRSNRRTERNWREEKRLIDKKSINNRRTEAERATRTRKNRWTEAERVTRTAKIEQNWREEKLLIDEKTRNNRRTQAERASRRAKTIDGLKQNWRL